MLLKNSNEIGAVCARYDHCGQSVKNTIDFAFCFGKTTIEKKSGCHQKRIWDVSKFSHIASAEIEKKIVDLLETVWASNKKPLVEKNKIVFIIEVQVVEVALLGSRYAHLTLMRFWEVFHQ